MNTITQPVGISFQALEKICPAAFSDSAAPHTSERYSHVRTADIVQKMLDSGFVIQNASQQKTQKRTAGNEQFQKHRITMRMPGDFGQSLDLGSVFPTVDLINSGNWSSKFLMALGLYRLICTNGMVAPVGDQAHTVNVRHNNINDDVMQAMDTAIASAPSLVDFADRAANADMSDNAITEYVTAAARLRWNFEKDESPSEAHLTGLGHARRIEDNKTDLWHTFNRVQENGTRGGFLIPDSSGKMRRSREVTNIAADTAWNQNLWSLTQSWIDRMN